MDSVRICNNIYKNDWQLTLKDFGMEHLFAEIMPRQAVEMSDVFIVTDDTDFKIIKCRVPNIPIGHPLPLSFLKYTIKLIHEWQEQ